jgi:hypothetical protein
MQERPYWYTCSCLNRLFSNVMSELKNDMVQVFQSSYLVTEGIGVAVTFRLLFLRNFVSFLVQDSGFHDFLQSL